MLRPCVEIRRHLSRADSLHCVSPRDFSQVIFLGGRHLCPLTHLADREVTFLVLPFFSTQESRSLLEARAAYTP